MFFASRICKSRSAFSSDFLLISSAVVVVVVVVVAVDEEDSSLVVEEDGFVLVLVFVSLLPGSFLTASLLLLLLPPASSDALTGSGISASTRTLSSLKKKLYAERGRRGISAGRFRFFSVGSGLDCDDGGGIFICC